MNSRRGNADDAQTLSGNGDGKAGIKGENLIQIGGIKREKKADKEMAIAE